MELMVSSSWTNNDEFVERMKCFRKKTSGETEYLMQLNTKMESGSVVFPEKSKKSNEHYNHCINAVLSETIRFSLH